MPPIVFGHVLPVPANRGYLEATFALPVRRARLEASGIAGKFETTVNRLGLEHVFTHPGSPRKAAVKRCHLALQEMFLFHLDLLPTDLVLGNRELARLLVLSNLYSAQLPRHALKRKNPIHAFAEATHLR